MSKLVWLGFVAVCVSLLATGALADPVGTGTGIAECDVNGHCCSTFTFDNLSYNVYGTPTNLGTDVGTAVSTNISITNFDNMAGHGGFNGDIQSYPTASVMSMHSDGSFICIGPPDCSQGGSFIGALTNVAGSLGLSTSLSYTEDGTLPFDHASASPTTPGCSLSNVNVFMGPIAFNAFQPVATPAGTNVTASTNSTFYDSSTGNQVTVTADITFSNVDSPGDTTMVAVSNAAGVIDQSFAVDVGSCSVSTTQACSNDGQCPSGETCLVYHAAFFDITTTATFSGPITVCSQYPDLDQDGIVDGTNIPEAKLRVLHKPDNSSDFQDVTASLDTGTNTICGSVTSLSPFVIATDSSSCVIGQGQTVAEGNLVLNHINVDATPGNDTLSLSGEFALVDTNATFADFDPQSHNPGAQIIVADAAGTQKVAISVLGGVAYAGHGTAGWMQNHAGNKWIFKDTTGTPANGLIKMIVKDLGTNHVQVIAKGKNGTYPIAAADAPLRTEVVLGGQTAVNSGACGKGAFAANECTLNGSGKKMHCKH